MTFTTLSPRWARNSPAAALWPLSGAGQRAAPCVPKRSHRSAAAEKQPRPVSSPQSLLDPAPAPAFAPVRSSATPHHSQPQPRLQLHRLHRPGRLRAPLSRWGEDPIPGVRTLRHCGQPASPRYINGPTVTRDRQTHVHRPNITGHLHGVWQWSVWLTLRYAHSFPVFYQRYFAQSPTPRSLVGPHSAWSLPGAAVPAL